MKSIKEKADELFTHPRGDDTEDTIGIDMNRAVDFIDGANYVLEQIEECRKEFYNINDSLIIARTIEKLKK